MTESSSAPARPTPRGSDLRLPTPPGVIRRFWARHPWVTDSIVAGIYFVPMAITLLVEAIGGSQSAAQISLNAVVAVPVAAALLFRRYAPYLVLAISLIGLLLVYPDYGQSGTLPVFFALYAVAVYRSVRGGWIGFGVAVVVGFFGAFLHQGTLDGVWAANASQYAILMLAATLIGINIGNRKRYVQALLDRAEQLARERDQQAQLARISERGRIAREMHDIIAHSLSVMVALADGADAIAEKDPGRSRAAMREVAETGRSSLTDMRRLLGVLADDEPGDAAGGVAADATLQPQPGIAQLPDLVESFRAAGLPTRLEQTGRAVDNPGIELTIYRIVQESLTNALRYALNPTQVVVTVMNAAGRVEVTVSDDGRRRSPAPSQGSGRGIIGLKERVALYGGSLDAAPTSGGGWRVRATMEFDEEEEK